MNITFFNDLWCGGDPLWDSALTWNSSNPQLTPCFEKTVLSWLPSAVLLLFSPYEVYVLCSSKNTSIADNWLNVSKTIICTIFVLFSAIRLGQADQDSYSSSMAYFTAAIHLITYIAVTLFTIWERKKGIHTSALQFFFWLTSLITGLIIYRHLLQNVIEQLVVYDFDVSIGVFTCPLILIQFVLNCFADKRPEQDVSGDAGSGDNCDENINNNEASGEPNASFLSSILCFWYTRFIFKGFRQNLELKDLLRLNPECETRHCYPKLEKYLIQELERCSHRNASVEDNTAGIRKKTSLPSNELNHFINIKKRATPNILKVLLQAFGNRFFGATLLKLVADMLQLVGPMIFRLLIDFFRTDSPQWQGYTLAVLMFAIVIAFTAIHSSSKHIALVVGLQMKVSLTSAIYRKVLTFCCSPSADMKSTVSSKQEQ